MDEGELARLEEDEDNPWRKDKIGKLSWSKKNMRIY